MKISKGIYEAELCTEYGVITSFSVNGRELLAKQNEPSAIWVKLIDNNGDYLSIKSGKVYAAEQTGDGYKFTYKNIGGISFNAETYIKFSDNSDFIYMTMNYENLTGYTVEFVNFGSFTVPHNLKEDGGDGKIFWPGAEGGIIHSVGQRDIFPSTKYREPDYDVLCGWRGCYPGFTQMQFMSYYTENGGFYLGHHDSAANLKMLEYHNVDEGIRLENFIFPGDASENHELGYDIVFSAFEGDWYTAADIYKEWLEQSGILSVKSRENKNIPAWMEDSPVIFVYAVRGAQDTGDMTPNCYFPLLEGLDYVYPLGKKVDSSFMPLLMHWEGTAPWAPPFVWPPFGGEEAFKKVVDRLHADGNYIGVYASGIGWTTYSYLNPEYKTDKLYEELEIEKYLCRTPKQTIDPTNVINAPIKEGHNICPEGEIVKEMAINEIVKVAKSGCDYFQFFDQNLGGQSCFCYSKSHNHAPSPGKWQGEEMKKLFRRATKELRNMNSSMAIGCEGAACETFVEDLTFNDLRFNGFYYFGEPVHAYSYVLHEYINNFMGNGCSTGSLNCELSPESLALRIAYNFVGGNFLSLTLRDSGHISWGWGASWIEGPKNEENILLLVKNLNAWRKGPHKEFLRYGRMKKPQELEGIGKYKLYSGGGDVIDYPDLMSGRFEDNGEDVQFVVNYFETEKTFSVDRDVTLYKDSKSTEGVFVEKNTTITVEPLSAVMIKF